MATIRPDQLPTGVLTDTAAFIADIGSSVIKVQPSDIVDKVAPVASESEALLGTNNTKRMTPLRVSQAIAKGESTTNIFVRPTRDQIANLTFANGIVAFLAEGITRESSGRSGEFMAVVGNFSAEVAADPLQGIYIAPSFDPTGGTGAWVRVWDWLIGRPEWFGAITNNPAIDNRPAINACIDLCPASQLASEDYCIAGTLAISRPFRTIYGMTPAWEGQGNGSRIVSTNTSEDVVLVGSLTFQTNDITLENIAAVWSEALTPPATGAEATAVKAWNIRGITSGKFIALSAFNPIIGFYAHRTVYCKWIDCRVYRNALYGGPNDFFRGFWVQGLPVATGYAGGNASPHFVRCNATLSSNSLNVVDATGFYANGAFADTIVDLLETSAVKHGIILDGFGTPNVNGHGDVRITNPTIDQGRGNGIDVKNLQPLAKVQISGGYVQIVDSGAGNKGIWLRGGGGQATVDNLQVTGEDTSSTSIGIRIDGQPNAVVSDTVIVENIAYPMDVINSCTRTRVLAQLQAGNCVSGGTRAAMTIDKASLGYFAPTISGPSGTWVTGINMNGSENTLCKVDMTMIDPGSIVSARKLTINGVHVTFSGWRKRDGSTGTEADHGINAVGFAS